MVVTRDGKDLKKSENFYLVAVSPTKMTGQRYNDARTALVNTGALPILARVIEGNIEFKAIAAVTVITPLNPDGSRGKAGGFRGRRLTFQKEEPL